DVVAGGPGPLVEGVVRRGGAVAVGPADLGRQRGQVLVHAGAVAVVADGPVQFSVDPEAGAAAVVGLAARRPAGDDRGVFNAHVVVVGVADDLLFAGGHRHEEVDVAVDRVVRVEGEADQAALAVGEDGGDGGEGLGQELTVLDNADLAALAAD